MAEKNKIHLVIPDTQAKPGVSTDHLKWIGNYIVDHFAGQDLTIIHLGDHWDLPSLSSYDRGKKSIEGRRLDEDIQAGNDALEILCKPLNDYNAKRAKNHKPAWSPQMHMLRGNHEDRLRKACEDNPQLDGVLSDDLFNDKKLGWEVHKFLEPVFLDGVGYSHYWYNPLTGKPYTGTSESMLKTIGHSFTMGHRQTLQYGLRFVAGKSQHSLIAGSCYLHDEDYKGPQGNAHWRGIIVKHQVKDGSYDPMFISLNYLSQRYTGRSLEL